MESQQRARAGSIHRRTGVVVRVVAALWVGAAFAACGGDDTTRDRPAPLTGPATFAPQPDPEPAAPGPDPAVPPTEPSDPAVPPPGPGGGGVPPGPSDMGVPGDGMPPAMPGDDMMPVSGMGGMDDGMPDGPGTMTPPVTDGEICDQWSVARADLSESPWDGDVASCAAGDMTAEARQTALGLVNLYRAMAGLSSVEMSEEGNRLAQACALLMRANNTISHSPSESWTCYTSEAARTAGASSLSSGPAVASVDGYMIDPGNPTTLGHRRWILSNMLTGIGFGSADRFSCQYQPAGRPAAGATPWVAWPPPGQIPIDAFGNRWASMDQTGWSVQSDSVNLASAQVTVTADGMDMPVTVTQLASGYGSRYAIRFNAMGWTATAGQTYHVQITGVSPEIEYDVEVVTCP